MIGTIFQLAGTLLLGYQVAIRGKKAMEEATIIDAGRYDEINRSFEYVLRETYRYRVGFLLIIVGYLIPFYKLVWLDNENPTTIAIVALSLAITVVLISEALIRVFSKIIFLRSENYKEQIRRINSQ